MKFNCDYFKDRKRLKRERQNLWHPWFAWYPVRISHGDCRLFEKVYRRKDYSYIVAWKHYLPYENHEDINKRNGEARSYVRPNHI